MKEIRERIYFIQFKKYLLEFKISNLEEQKRQNEELEKPLKRVLKKKYY